MAERSETRVVFAAGLAQGLALVSVPAAASILTSPTEYGLSSTAYGALFVPQAAAAIAASLGGAGITRRLGLKRVFVAGLGANLVAMTLLALSAAISGSPAANILLIGATTSLGFGFGLTVPALNRYAALFYPDGQDRAVLTLNALLGLGTALAPILIAIFIGVGAWWGLPVMVALGFVILIALSSRLALAREGAAPGTPASHLEPHTRARPSVRLPPRFWVFAAGALLYGIVETLSGNWSTSFMSTDLGASATTASLALATFWATVTIGRILVAAIGSRVPDITTYRILPFVVAVAFVALGALPTGSTWGGLVAFGLAGLGCSALLPLTISFGQAELTTIPTVVTGGVIGFYQIGYGLAAFGVGPLLDRLGLSLAGVFEIGAVVAVGLGVLCLVIVRTPPSPAQTSSENRST